MLQAPNPRHYSAEHEVFRTTVRRFFETEVAPHANDWDEAGEFPRALYRKAAEAGILGLNYPEEFGGTGSAFSASRWSTPRYLPADPTAPPLPVKRCKSWRASTRWHSLLLHA